MSARTFFLGTRLEMMGLLLGLAVMAPGGAQAAPVQTPYARTEPLAIRGVALSTPTVACYARVELTVDFSATYQNPFDPAEVAVDGQFRAPSGKSVSVPGFLYRPYTRAERNGGEALSPAGEPSWRVRFTPSEAGPYEATVKARDRSGEATSQPVRFTATAAEGPGFVRVSEKDRRYFAFENGKPYFPIGANVCWAGGRGTAEYDTWFARYAEAGCNYARLWLSPLWTTFALEQPGKPEAGKGLGQFDLANAWRLEYVLDLAAEKGLYLMLCIDSYNILRQKDGYPQWDNTPHNAVHGGPLQQPAEFWTNSVMEQLYLNKLRYLVARYGWSPHVLSWEFWNEADITTSYRSEPSRQWHARMAAALRAMDPCRHLITTSFANTRGDPAVDQLPGLDYAQTHHYNSPDLAVTLAKAQAQKSAYGKPHLVGEIGADSGGPRGQDDPEGLQVHDPIWVTLVTGAAGTAQPWWWDNLIQPRKLYPLFGAAVRYAKDIDWPGEGFHPASVRVEWPAGQAASSNAPPVLAWALVGNHTALAWARVEGRTWRRICRDKQSVPAAPASVLVVAGLGAGTWGIEFWDTWQGKIFQKKEAVVPASGEARVELPGMEKDVAVKMRRGVGAGAR
jgi:hypothetical protein